MTISASLFNANSGLVAAARAAEAVANNVANAMTESYGRREVNLSAASLDGRGAGVRVASVSRVVDETVLSDRRAAQASLASAEARGAALSRISGIVGVAGEIGALSAVASEFESALISAAANPASDTHLQTVQYRAVDLATAINAISDTIQAARSSADKTIASEVDTLNTTLSRIAELDKDIRLQTGKGRDVNGLLDQRQELVDVVSEIIPVRVYLRDHGQIALVSTGGAVLYDGKPAELGFVPAGAATPEMTVETGGFGGVTLNGRSLTGAGGSGLLAGGSLAANFEMRDDLGPQAQARIDAVARDLIERFQTPGLDATLSAGTPGLFTDDGLMFDATRATGLAQRLSVSALVIPESGGHLWRLRDGLGAAGPGPAGDNTLLAGFAQVLRDSRPSHLDSGTATDFAGIVGEHEALAHADRIASEDQSSFMQARYHELKAVELAGGVDADQEMQKLLMIEQAFAANAKVIASVDQMMKTLIDL